MMTYIDTAHLVMDRCDQLAGCSEEPDRLTRRYGTDAMRQANEAVAGWMAAAGMGVRRDGIGNLVARYEAVAGDAASASPPKTLLLGSHLDSVRDAGKYDGPLGVLVALACVERFSARGQRLPFAIEVVAFADEEGLRFPTAYLGSTAFIGAFQREMLDLTDSDGVTVAEAIRSFGGDPDSIGVSAPASDALLGYCEVHIEQGPVLDANGLPLGIVSAIQGQTRVTITITGVAGHAGTVPMSLRHDALGAASEFVVAVERLAADTPAMVATVGQLAVDPGASNVIPGRVTLSLDLRHPDDQTRQDALGKLRTQAESLATRRGVTLEWLVTADNPSVRCSPQLIELVSQAVAATGNPVYSLASGAGHDAAMLATLTRIAMLFVRCKAGVSHSPAESVMVEDVAVAIEALERFVLLLMDAGSSSGAALAGDAQ